MPRQPNLREHSDRTTPRPRAISCSAPPVSEKKPGNAMRHAGPRESRPGDCHHGSSARGAGLRAGPPASPFRRSRTRTRCSPDSCAIY